MQNHFAKQLVQDLGLMGRAILGERNAKNTPIPRVRVRVGSVVGRRAR